MAQIGVNDGAGYSTFRKGQPGPNHSTNHTRGTNVRRVRAELNVGPPTTKRYGSDPIITGKGQKSPGKATPYKAVDTKRAAPKQTAPLSYSDRLNYRTGRTSPVDDVARADIAAEENKLRTKGRSLKSQEATIARLRQYGILRPAVGAVGGDFTGRRGSGGGGDFGTQHPGGLFTQAVIRLPLAGGALASATDAVGQYLGTGGGALGKALEGAAGSTVDFAANHLHLGQSPFGAIKGDNQATVVKEAGRVAKDALDIPIQGVPALYQIGRAGVHATEGDLKPAKALASGIANSSAIGHLARGDFKGAGKIAQEHPLDTALELSGVRAAIGRSAGAALRSGAFGKGAARLGSTARADAEILGGGNVHETRHYSPDLIVKGAQRLNEKIQARTGVNLAHFDPHAGRNPDVITGARSVRKLQKRMHETAGANEIMRRELRDAGGATMKQLEPGARYVGQHADTSTLQSLAQRVTHGIRTHKGTHSDIVGLMAQKIARSPHTLPEDLANYRRIVDESLRKAQGVKNPDAAHYMAPNEQAAAKEMLASIDKALGDKAFMAHPEEHFVAANAYNRLRGEVDSVKEGLGLLTPRQAEARQLPALIVHADAERKFESDLPPDVRAARADFARTSAQLTHEQAAGDTYGLVRGLRHQADDLAHKIRAAGYDPTQTYSGWHIGDHPISVEDAGNLLHHIEADGAGFLSHNPRNHGSAAFFKPSSRRPALPVGMRTGDALRKGYAASNYEAMTHDIVGALGSAEQARAFDRTVQLHGFGKFSGENAFRDAANAAKTFNRTPGNEAHALIPVRLTPLHEAPPGLWDTIESMGTGLAEGSDHAAMGEAKTLFDEARKDGPGAVTLMPEKVFKDWQALATGTAGRIEGLRAMQSVTQGFKHTVLPFSTRWFAGNHVEAGLRSLFYGHGPADLMRGHRLMNVMREHNPELYRIFRAHAFGGRLYGSHRMNTLYRTLDDMRTSRLRHVVVPTAHVVRTLLKPIRPLQEGIFALNDFLERQATAAAIGAKVQKEIRETAGSFKNAITISDQMMRDYIDHHLVDENKVAEFGRYADEALGRYSKHSPMERALIQTFLPFGDWYRNSIKFIFNTMPVHHPIKTGLIAATEQAYAAEMDKEGQHLGSGLAKTAPFLLGSVPGGAGGKRIDLAHLTPFGVMQDPLGSAADLVMPQFSSLGLNLAGQSWKRNDLTDGPDRSTNDTALRGIAALNTLLGSFVPGYSLGERFAEGGGSAYDDSTLVTPHTRPDTREKGGRVALHILDPFFPKKPGGRTGTASSLSTQYGVGRSRAGSLRKQYGVGGSAAALKKQYGVGGG